MRKRFSDNRALELLRRTFHEFNADDATHMAAGVAYYAILSLFPLLLALIGGMSLILESDRIQSELVEYFKAYMPGSEELLGTNVQLALELRGAVSILGLLGLVWTASGIFGAVSKSVNRAWDVHKDRPFYIAKARQMGMAAAVGVLFVLSLGATTALQTLGQTSLPFVGRLSFLDNAAIAGVGRIVPLVFTLGIFLLLYKMLPNTKTYWRYVWPGAVVAAVLFETAKSMFVLYLDRFANYSAVYGSLGSVVALLIWAYASALILIVGAEFASEYGRMRAGVARGTLIDENLID